MYLELFQLKAPPFQLTPDAEFLFMSKAHSRAKACMDYAIWNRDGFVVITGDVGTGKTTLIQKFLSELAEDVVVAKVFQTQIDPVGFLQAALTAFGLNPFDLSKAELLQMFNAFLVENFERSRRVVLIVDEAQNLDYDVLEEIRLLSGMETGKEKILQVMLVGQPDLKERLELPELEQLLQRVRLRFHLRPLSEAETRSYVLHRLRIAGAAHDNIFAEETFAPLYRYTGGIPRLINTLCDTALTCAYADDISRVTVDVLRTAIEELQWQPYRKRVPGARASKIGSNDALLHRLPQLLVEHKTVLDEIVQRLKRLETVPQVLALFTLKTVRIEEQLNRIAARLDESDRERPSRYTTKSRY